jgi:excisionase family DNA binding protein
METQPLALRVNAAAAAIGVGKSTLYLAMEDGSLPFCKIGSMRVILREDLERFLRAHRVAEAT